MYSELSLITFMTILNSVFEKVSIYLVLFVALAW